MKKQLLALSMLAAAFTLKAQNPYPILPIDSVQFVNQARLSAPDSTLPDYIRPLFKDSVYRDTVRFEGVVLTNPQIYGLSGSRKAAYLQRVGGGPWSSIMVMCEPSGSGLTLAQLKAESKFFDNFIPGKFVRVTGVIRDFAGETQVNLIRDNANFSNAVELLSLNDTGIVWTEMEARNLMTGNPNTGWVRQKLTAEPYEGSPVIIRNVTVYNVAPNGANRNNWSVIDDFGNVLEIRDFSGYYRRDDNEDTIPKIANTFQPPPIGTRLEYLRGIVTEYATGSGNGIQRYGIAPIHPSDVKVCTSCPPIIKNIGRMPQIPVVNDSISVFVEISTGDTTLKSRVFYYKLPGSSTIDSLVMAPRPSYPNQFMSKVATGATTGVFSFWVRAEDNRDRSTFFPDPLLVGKSVYITPNGVNSISMLQYSDNDALATIWDGDTLSNIDVRGVVTTNDALGNMITVQDGQGPNSAIYVHRSATWGTDTLKAGDSIQITKAFVQENFNVTTLYSVLYNLVSRDNPLPPFATNLPMDSFTLNRFAYARPYEGVLVRFDSVKVISANPDAPANDFGEFSIYPKNGTTTNGLRIEDMSAGFKGVNRIVKPNLIIGFIQGPMYFANGYFKLAPRNMMDIDLTGVDTIAPIMVILGDNPDTVSVGSGAYADAGATAVDNKDGNIAASIVKNSNVNTTIAGSYTITYNVSDAWGNAADELIRTVVVTDTAVGLNKNQLLDANINVFPNPASNVITITASDVKNLPLQLAVYDVVGRMVISRTYTQNNVNQTIDISGLNNGVYFCVFSNSQGTHNTKFIVNSK